MRKDWGLILAALGVFVAGVGNVEAGGAKIAVVDMARLIQAHPDTQKANDLLARQRDEYDAEKKDLLETFDAMREKFNATQEAAFDKALSEEGREQKRKEAEQQLRELEAFKRKIQDTFLQRQQELTDLQKRMGARITRKIRAVIETYSKENGIVLVFNMSGRGLSGVENILYASEILDITDAIMKRIQEAGDKAKEGVVP